MNTLNQSLLALNKIYTAIYNKGVAVGNQTLTVDALKSLTIPSNQEVNYCKIYVGTADISYWVDGSTPTASQGLVAAAGNTIEIFGTQNIRNFKCIPVSSTATIQIQYYNIDIPKNS